MLSVNQLEALSIKSSIILKILNNEALDSEELQKLFQLENAETIFQKLDGLFRLLFVTIKDNNLKVFDSIDPLNCFLSLCNDEEEQAFVQFYNNFLDYLINDNKDLDVSDRLASLIQLESIGDQVANESETKQLYLYNALSLALASAPVDYDLVNRLNAKLKKTFVNK